jgi:hypothetical protein
MLDEVNFQNNCVDNVEVDWNRLSYEWNEMKRK